MKTVRCTTAEAIVRYLVAQRIMIDDELRPLFAGAFAIFGHGNVTSLGVALEAVKDEFPTWRGQNVVATSSPVSGSSKITIAGSCRSAAVGCAGHRGALRRSAR